MLRRKYIYSLHNMKISYSQEIQVMRPRNLYVHLFCESYRSRNYMKETTCFKNQDNSNLFQQLALLVCNTRIQQKLVWGLAWGDCNIHEKNLLKNDTKKKLSIEITNLQWWRSLKMFNLRITCIKISGNSNGLEKIF